MPPLSHGKVEGVIGRIADGTPRRERAILGIEEQSVIAIAESLYVNISLQVRPVIPVEVPGNPENSLRRRESARNAIDHHSARLARTKVERVHPGREICWKYVVEVGHRQHISSKSHGQDERVLPWF